LCVGNIQAIIKLVKEKTKRDDPEKSSEATKEFQSVTEFYRKKIMQADHYVWRIFQNIREASSFENSETITDLDIHQVNIYGLFRLQSMTYFRSYIGFILHPLPIITVYYCRIFEIQC
jgi:hypothetical protein